MKIHPPFSIFTAMMSSPYEVQSGSPLWFLAADGFFRGGAAGSRSLRGRGQSHFNLELLDQFAGLNFLRVVFDLPLLLVNLASGHVHAGLVDGGYLFHRAHPL